MDASHHLGARKGGLASDGIECQSGVLSTTCEGGPEMNATTYAIDIAKAIFQLHWVEPDTGVIHRRKLQRAKLMEFFARLQPSRILMEACGGAHHWGRELSKLGHHVELLPPHKVKESASGNKDDARDARAIWVTGTQKDVRRVPVKTVEQQAQLFTHRVRSHWVSL